MNIKVNASGAVKTIVNGNVVENAGFNSNYDGKKMEISGYNDGERFYTELDNNDINKILSLPSHKLSLGERLKRDFKLNKTKRSKSNKNKNKNKKKTRKH